MASDLPLPDSAAAAVRAVLDAFAGRFPGRLRAAYVEGSFADGTAVPTSDVDLLLLVWGRFRTAQERRAAAGLLAAAARASPIELDAAVLDAADLAAGAPPSLKLAARRVWGEDALAGVPLVPLPVWTRDRMHTSLWRTATLFGSREPVRLPVGYPDPADACFGYARRPVRLADGTEVPSTRDLLRHAGWAATALVAWHAGVYVARKRDCHALYARHVGDEHGRLLEDLYTRCRGAWHYRVPDRPAERAALRDLCARTLPFENRFLAAYRQFVLDELRGPAAGTESRLAALAVLRRVRLADPTVFEAIAALTASADAAVRTAATTAQQHQQSPAR